jgi:hypothetical protein
VAALHALVKRVALPHVYDEFALDHRGHDFRLDLFGHVGLDHATPAAVRTSRRQLGVIVSSICSRAACLNYLP